MNIYQFLAAFAIGMLTTNLVYMFAFAPGRKRRLDILLEEMYRKRVRSRLKKSDD